MQLYSIDPATGTTTFITNITGAAGVEAITFAPNGTVYAAGSPSGLDPSRTLYTLSTTTGELSLVGPILVNGSPVSDIDTLEFASDGYLYGADAVSDVQPDIIRIDPATGVGIVIGKSAVTGLSGLLEVFEVNIAITGGLQQECAESGGTTVEMTVGSGGTNLASVIWTVDGDIVGTTETINHFLGLGSHSVRVDVVANNGATARDTTVVDVIDTIPPEVTATIVDAMSGQVVTQATNAMRLLPSISATDVCDSAPLADAIIGVPSANEHTLIANKTATGMVINAQTTSGELFLLVTAVDASGNEKTEKTAVEVTPR